MPCCTKMTSPVSTRSAHNDGPIDMVGGDFRGLDLRELNADGVDFRDAYFRSADLRGIDFRNCIARRRKPGPRADFRSVLPAGTECRRDPDVDEFRYALALSHSLIASLFPDTTPSLWSEPARDSGLTFNTCVPASPLSRAGSLLHSNCVPPSFLRSQAVQAPFLRSVCVESDQTTTLFLLMATLLRSSPTHHSAVARRLDE